jgi:hypothetical protein
VSAIPERLPFQSCPLPRPLPIRRRQLAGLISCLDETLDELLALGRSNRSLQRDPRALLDGQHLCLVRRFQFTFWPVLKF